MLRNSQRTAARELKAWGRLKQEREWLAHQVPALTTANQAAVAAEVVAGANRRDQLRQRLEGDGPGSTTTVAESTDTFFGLVEFVGKLRAQATQAEVKLKSDECFGFASYAHTGPVAGQIATILRQREAMDYLMDQLLESRPDALLSVRRERAPSEVQLDGKDRVADTLELNPRLSIRMPGRVEADAYQFEFTGDTAVLRAFLNRLATGSPPVVVRSVQVEPSGVGGPTAPPATAMTAADPLSWAHPRRSKFDVTVELARPAEGAAKAVP